MIVGYISDLHIDFYVKAFQAPLKYYKRFFKDLKGIDVLVIAGDMGHYNEQFMKLTEYILEDYPDIHIIFIGGNHELYLLSKSARKKYEHNSWNRLKELEEYAATKDRLHYLDGNMVVIDNVVFGGIMGWYRVVDYAKWLNASNDSNYITEGIVLSSPRPYTYNPRPASFDVDKVFEGEVEKLLNLKVDVLITHIPMISIPPEHNPQYADSVFNEFYMVDLKEFVKSTEAKYYIFGHIHQAVDFIEDDIHCISNPVGYPDECDPKTFKIKTLEIF
jgi:predicted phosphodiesterase